MRRATIAASGSRAAISRASGRGLSSVGLAASIGRPARTAATVTSRLRGAGRCRSPSCDGARSVGALAGVGLALTTSTPPPPPRSTASVVSILVRGVASIPFVVNSFAAIIVGAGAAIIIVGLRCPRRGFPLDVKRLWRRLGCWTDHTRLASNGPATARAFLGRRGVRFRLRLTSWVATRATAGASRIIRQSSSEIIVGGPFEFERLQLVTDGPFPRRRTETSGGTLGRTRTIGRHERFQKKHTQQRASSDGHGAVDSTARHKEH